MLSAVNIIFNICQFGLSGLTLTGVTRVNWMYLCRRTKLCVPCKAQYPRRCFRTRRCLHSRLAYSHHRDSKWNTWVNAHSLFCGLCIRRCWWYRYFSRATSHSLLFLHDDWIICRLMGVCAWLGRVHFLSPLPYTTPGGNYVMVEISTLCWCRMFYSKNQCISMCFGKHFRDMLYNVLSVIRRRWLVLCYTWWECEWSSLPEEFKFERRMWIHWPACFV
jgi:hypothetical protein